MLELRGYQREALDALYAYWQEGGGNALLSLPTGSGKSLVIAKLTQELLESWPKLRIGIVTHSRELISQNYKELISIWPDAPAGIYSAGIGRRDTRHRILFMGVQSVHKRVGELVVASGAGGFDVLIVDEAHLLSPNSETMYGQLIGKLRDIVPDMRVVGLTATPYRLDSGFLHGKPDDGKIFDKLVYEAGVVDLINAGYLSPLLSRAGVAEIDVSKVAKRGGEFVPGALEAAADVDSVTRAAAAELAALGAERKAWLVFCAGIKHADHMRDALRDLGIAAESINGETPKAIRDSVIQRFRAGQLQALISVNVLSIGFNVPQVDLIALMRPTLSTGLYVQQVGRGFRNAPGKQNCVILDYSGNVRRHGPVDAVEPRRPRAKGESEEDEAKKVAVDEVRAKECPSCLALVGLRSLSCGHCGYSWPVEAKHEAKADALTPILSTERVKPRGLPVIRWSARRHTKEGSPDSVCVSYYAGVSIYREWVCFEHKGFAGEKAKRWWHQHSKAAAPIYPKTVTEALERFRDLRIPSAIMVKSTGKWFEVVGREFGQREAA